MRQSFNKKQKYDSISIPITTITNSIKQTVGNEMIGNVEISLTRVELGSFRNYWPVKEPSAFHHETYNQHVNTTRTSITLLPFTL